MKRKLFLGGAALLTAIAVGVYIQTNADASKNLLTLNIEALSNAEADGPVKCTAGWTQCATNGTTTLYKK